MAFHVLETSAENRFMRGNASWEEPLRDCFSFLKRCEPPLMLIYGEFGTVA